MKVKQIDTKPVLREIKPLRVTSWWASKFSHFHGPDLEKWVMDMEIEIENEVIDLLEELGIYASTKTNRYSLPTHGVIMSSSGFDSYLPSIYSSKYLKRDFIKMLLDEECYKVRFYVYIHTMETGEKGFRGLASNKFNIELRYFLHKYE